MSDITVVAGAIATVQQWEKQEAKWSRLMQKNEIDDFQWKDWLQMRPPFSQWGPSKKRAFSRAQDDIIRKNTMFRCFESIDKAAHADVKGRMRRIKGFQPDSDYGLGLRVLMFKVCDEIVANLDEDCRLSVMVEDGPWAAGGLKVYQAVSRMTGKWKPGRHAHRLAGFAAVPKGERPSLSAADYIAGRKLEQIQSGTNPRPTQRDRAPLADA